MACDVLLIIAMIVFLLKYWKTMQAMLTAFLQTNTKNNAIQSVQADQIGRTYPPLFMVNCKVLYLAFRWCCYSLVFLISFCNCAKGPYFSGCA